MATALAVSDGIELTVYTHVSEQVGVNVLHYRVSSVAGGITDADMATVFAETLEDAYIGWLSDDAQFDGIKVRIIGVLGGGPAPVFGIGDQLLGTTGSTLPRQLSGLLRKRANLQGPKGRGRVYVPFPGNDTRTGAGVSVAGLAALETISGVIYGTAGTVTVNAGGGKTVSMLASIGNAGAPLTWQLMTTLDTSGHFATQKRRGFFGRPNSLPAELG